MNELTEENLDRLDQYIASELDDESRAEVDRLIANDPAWRDAYALRMAVRETGRKKFEQEMRTRFKEIDSKGHRKVMVRPIWLAVAASIALLVSAVLWLLPENTPNALFAEYRTFPNIVLPIEKSGGTYTKREMAYHAYELGDYSAAIGYFTSLDSTGTVERLYLGLSYLESGDFDSARSVLDEVRASSNPRWSQVADWYTMWLYVREKEMASAKSLLKLIAGNPQHRYQEEAQKLLDKL